MKKTYFACWILGFSLVLSACGAIAPSAPAVSSVSSETAAPAGPPTATPDLCSQANLPDAVKIVNTYVHQFDNYGALATTVSQAQLPQLVTSLKSIRQAAQQQGVPPCLTELKHYALQYMDAVIQTLISFQVSPNIETLNGGILQARQFNDQYAAELARLLGVTLAPVPTAAAQGGTQPSETAEPPTTMVLNPGPNALNLHVSPSLTSQAVGVLNASEQAKALGKSSTGEWILIEVPGSTGQSAWVYASLVEYTSGDISILPVATP